MLLRQLLWENNPLNSTQIPSVYRPENQGSEAVDSMQRKAKISLHPILTQAWEKSITTHSFIH